MAAQPKPGSMRDRARRTHGEPEDETETSRPDRATSRQSWQASRPAPESRPAPRKKWKEFDPAYVPEGAQPDYWHLAILFRDLALKDDITLRGGVPIIYDAIRQAFARFDLENGSRPFQRRGDGTVELTFAQVYRDGEGDRRPWPQVGEAVVREFWRRQWDSDALDYFCDIEILSQMVTRVCERWLGQRLRAKAAASPRPTPEPMTWSREGHNKRRRISVGE